MIKLIHSIQVCFWCSTTVYWTTRPLYQRVMYVSYSVTLTRQVRSMKTNMAGLSLMIAKLWRQMHWLWQSGREDTWHSLEWGTVPFQLESIVARLKMPREPATPSVCISTKVRSEGRCYIALEVAI